MSPHLATVAHRVVELGRVARRASTDAWWDLWRQAPFLSSAGGILGIAAVLAASKLFPVKNQAPDELRLP